jgi:5-(carboxyamino)imidazole ribonucleotide mutase
MLGVILMSEPKVALIMGSDSDFPALKPCIRQLKDFGIVPVVRVLSAHRTPHEAASFAENAEKNGIKVIIGAAGKAAHLPGVLAAFTTLPVIGVPMKSSTLDGMDSLLSIVQMPKGIPVATVAIDGGENAAILAAQILSLTYPEISEKLKAFKKEMARAVTEKNTRLQAEAELI